MFIIDGTVLGDCLSGKLNSKRAKQTLPGQGFKIRELIFKCNARTRTCGVNDLGAGIGTRAQFHELPDAGTGERRARGAVTPAGHVLYSVGPHCSLG